MEKKTVFEFSDGADYSGLIFEEFDAIEEWIKNEIADLSEDDLADRVYTIRIKKMTEDEIANLPEAE